MENPFVVEPMQFADLEAVCALEMTVGLSTFGVNGFAQRLNDPSNVLLVVRAPHIVGMFSGWVILDELEVDNLVVAASHRRQGIGATLLRKAISKSQALGARAAVLEVRAGNVAAQKLYESFGFVVAGRRIGYYQYPAEDALIMRLTINQNEDC